LCVWNPAGGIITINTWKWQEKITPRHSMVAVTARPVIRQSFNVMLQFLMTYCACLCAGHGETHSVKQSAMHWGQRNMTLRSTETTCSHEAMLHLRLYTYTSSCPAIQFTINNLKKQGASAGKVGLWCLKITPPTHSFSPQMGILYISSVHLVVATRFVARLRSDFLYNGYRLILTGVGYGPLFRDILYWGRWLLDIPSKKLIPS
jgi:hypothetical protein